MLEKYIQFAIDNGYIQSDIFINPSKIKIKINKYSERVTFWEDISTTSKTDLIRLITSASFIETIARGLITNNHGKEILDYEIEDMLTRITNDLTIKQAIAIKDNKLEKFIEEILA